MFHLVELLFRFGRSLTKINDDEYIGWEQKLGVNIVHRLDITLNRFGGNNSYLLFSHAYHQKKT